MLSDRCIVMVDDQAEHAIVLASTVYFLNKLRHVKLSQLVKAVPGTFLFVSRFVCPHVCMLTPTIGAQKLVSQQIESETTKAAAEMFPAALAAKQMLTIPKEGHDGNEILAEMRGYQKYDANGSDGKTFAYSNHSFSSSTTLC
jgi:hypothetical protein